MFLALALYSGLAAGGAIAGKASSLDAREWVTHMLGRVIRTRDTEDILLQKMLMIFHQADLDGGGVSRTDHELADRTSSAQRRAEFVAEWLGRDLDGDTSVTRAELEAFYSPAVRGPMLTPDGQMQAPTHERIWQNLDKQVRDALAVDGDGDGVVTLAEIKAAAEDMLAWQDATWVSPRRPVPLYLDRDGDGIVTESEFLQNVEPVLATIDADGDGDISDGERIGFSQSAKEMWEGPAKKRREQEEFVRMLKSCAFPKVSEQARVVLLDIQEGNALSTVSLGGDEETVTVAEVEIEPGAAPLYIILSSRKPLIWRFFGAVERVAFAVASADEGDRYNRPRVGVTGIPDDRVYIPPRAGCMKEERTTLPSVAGGDENGLIYRLIGRGAEFTTKSTRVSRVTVPSFRFSSRNAELSDMVPLPVGGESAPVWQSMLRFYPAGLIRIDAASVVSRAPARPYEVLPQQAGLAQLVDEGAIRIVPTDEAIELFRPRKIYPSQFYFLILRQIRFPSGLAGGHAVNFKLAPGSPLPDGDRAHSSLQQ